MSQAPLAERLKRSIREGGPLTFAAFMETALYDPAEGFYEAHSIGRSGEFLTSPHVSSAFGALVARQIEEFWELLDRPAPFRVVEVGAGDGTLAHQILRALTARAREATSYLAVDRSESARRAAAGPDIDVASSLEGLTPGPGVVLANELLDNLPFHMLRRGNEGLKELYVDSDGGAFAFVEGPPSSQEVAGHVPDGPSRDLVVARPAALEFMDRAAATITRGYLLIIDYGWPSPRAASVHGYRAHRLEEDVLEDPGSKDITAGVDFGALSRHARGRGWQVWGPITQRRALLALGYRDLDEEGRSRQVEAIAERRGTDALHTFDQRNRASLLVAKGGLGDFLVLCVGVGGVQAPVRLSAVDVTHDEEDASQDGDEVGHEGSG